MAEPKRRWRWVRRTLLGLTLIGSAGAGGAWWWWYSHTPGYHWKRAGVSVAAKDWPTAEIHLQNVLAIAPEHVVARVTLANVLVELANRGKEQPSNVDPPAAIEQLVEVARLEPKNTVIRERLLRNYVRSQRNDAAATMAQELAALGTTHGDALFLAANVALTEKRWPDAEKIIERFGDKVTRSAPIYMALRVQLFEGKKDVKGLDKWLSQLVGDTNFASDLERRTMSANERRALGTVLTAAVRCAPRESADRRFLSSLAILERIALAGDPALRVEYVEQAARLCSLLDSVHSPPLAATKGADPAEARRTAMRKLLRFAEPTLKAGVATPLIYEQMARAAALIGGDLRSLTLLQQGIEQHRKLPVERQRELLSLQWQSAVRLVMDRRYAEASKHLSSLRKYPETKLFGLLLEGAIALEEGRLELAQKLLTELVAHEGAKPGIVERSLLIRVQFALRQWEPALKLSQQLDADWNSLSVTEQKWFAETQGGREQLQLRQAVCLLEMNQSEPARQILQQLDEGPLRAKSRLLRVLDLTRSQQRKQAWDVLRLARRDAPTDLSLLLVECNLLTQEGAVEGALRLLAGHVQRQPRDLVARLVLSRGLAQKGDAVGAARELSEARRLFPDNETPWLLTAESLMSSGKADELKKLMQTMQSRPALATLVPLLQANWNLRQAGLADAADALEKADPELRRQAGFTIAAAEVAWGQHDAQRAFDLFADALDFTHTRPLVRDDFWKSFQAALQTSNPRTIADRIEQLRTKYPNEPVVLLASAELAMRQGDVAAALKRIEQLEKVDPLPSRSAYLRARLYSTTGRLAEARTEIQRALEAAPTHEPSRLLAAQLEFVHRGYARVLTLLQGLSASSIERLEVVLLRAESLAKLNQTVEAQQLLESLIRKQPQQPQAYLALAAMLAAADQKSLAVDTLRRGLQQLPKQPQLQAALLKLIAEVGQLREANDSLQGSRLAPARRSDDDNDPMIANRIQLLCLAGARQLRSCDRRQDFVATLE